MFLPTNITEMRERGWDQCDFILITPDAYVDHPSFAMALLGRFLEKNGLKVGILSQPKWQNPESFLELGIPKLAWGISGGNMDSMVLNYTPSGKRRMEDLYCEDGNPYFPGSEKDIKNKIRPDRTVTVYANQLRRVEKEKPLIIGGIEASLRRIAHYDHWSGKVRRSILFDAKADILVYGMGESPLLEILNELEAGKNIEEMKIPQTGIIRKNLEGMEAVHVLPSFEEVKESKETFARAYGEFYKNQSVKILAQQQDTRYLVLYPPSQEEKLSLDSVFDVSYERRPHPRFQDIPAFNMIENSVTVHRGCYGNCSFCAISLHQGGKTKSRSSGSIVREVKEIASQKGFPGIISDLGGPSANMYASICTVGGCAVPDCLKRGQPCLHLKPGIEEYANLLDKVSSLAGVKKVFIASGLRFDPVLMDEKFLTQVLKNYTPGQLKIAPEAGSDDVLALMNKPPVKVFRSFFKLFEKIRTKLGKKTALNPYFITGHPGENENQREETREFIRDYPFAGNQFQIFTPTPMTLATCIYYTGIHPFTGEKVFVEKNLKGLERAKEGLVFRKKG